MSTQETKSKSFAIATVLFVVFLLFALLYAWLSNDDGKNEKQTVVPLNQEQLLTDEQIGKLSERLARIKQIVKEEDFRAEFRKTLDEAKKLRQETDDITKDIYDLKKQFDEMRVLVKELERLLCEKGMIQDCKSI
ncbi:MAG: hypothetical protein HYT93_02740 [Parcubacteria group bacterium]|nr:hypothetical protein [Parcubacteria group bacterium]